MAILSYFFVSHIRPFLEMFTFGKFSCCKFMTGSISATVNALLHLQERKSFKGDEIQLWLIVLKEIC